MSWIDSTAHRLKTYAWVMPLALGLIVLLAPYWASVSFARQAMVIAIMVLLVSGLNLAWGFGGELAISQVAMYAAGAYTTGYLAIQGYDMAVSLAATLLVVTVLGLVAVLPSLRFSGWGLVMSSFFLITLIPDIVDLFPEQTGGQTGLLGIPDPVIFGQQLDTTAFYFLVIGCTLVWLALMRNLVVGRHGIALQVMRDSPVLAQSMGYNVTRLKVTLYVLGALPAGVAGWLFAYLDRFIAPEYFNFGFVILVVAASVLSGIRTVYGAVIGVTVLEVATGGVGVFEQYTFVAYGFLLILGGIFLGGKTYNRVYQAVQRRMRPSYVGGPSTQDSAAIPAVAGLALQVDGVEKHFGAVRALDGVSLRAEPGKITALIGANGSGKTTLLNVISGYYSCDGGQVLLDGREVPAKQPAAVALTGIARTFQTPIMPSSISVVEAVSAARYRRSYVGTVSAMLRLPSYRRATKADAAHAREWIETVGIGALGDVEANQLPLGSRRLVEVARALAGEPSVLLLDEPASGLEASEVDGLADLLRNLRDAGATIVLVEHNFDLICSVADDVYVLDRGRLIAHGSADEIRNDEAVARSYLGIVDEDNESEDAELVSVNSADLGRETSK